jgi:hypothetical protein
MPTAWMLRPVGMTSMTSRVIGARGDVLHVDDRRLAGDRDRLGDGAHLQIGVDVRGEVRRQLDALAAHRREAGQK